ncbi:MAG: hypothetical protein J7L30_00595 [Methanophagales archaeon]|nr:hypothetical protein [Methanophagales archaeon]
MSAKGTTSTCPMCGGSVKHRKGQVVCKKCGLTSDRQLRSDKHIDVRISPTPECLLPLGCETHDEVDENADVVQHEGVGKDCHEWG